MTDRQPPTTTEPSLPADPNAGPGAGVEAGPEAGPPLSNAIASDIGLGAGITGDVALPGDLEDLGFSMSPWRLAWKSFRRRKPAMLGLFILIVFYIVAIFAEFIAPYGSDSQDRKVLWTPPTHLHFSDERGFSFRPFVYPIQPYTDENFEIHQREDRTRRSYVRFLAAGDSYHLMGLIPGNVHLFECDTVNDPAYSSRLYLLGSDISGRDIFSRICYASRISMSIGLLGTFLVLLIGLTIGGASGYFGGAIDSTLQRIGEMVMLLPGFYLLLMLRFTFPPGMNSPEVYFAVILIMALVGWPGLARVIRGMVLSIRSENYVSAAEAIGAPTSRIIARHILPNTASYIIVSATLSIPGYILGESALSLLGLGIMEPTPSWGNMLEKAMSIVELDAHPWVLWPGFFIFLAVIAFNLVGDGLRDALDPRKLKT